MLHADRSAWTKEQITVQNIPLGWTWERFRVVRLGNGEFAFHSAIHNRFLRMNPNGYLESSDQINWNALPNNWSWERFKIKTKDGRTYIEGINNLVITADGASNRVYGTPLMLTNGTTVSDKTMD